MTESHSQDDSQLGQDLRRGHSSRDVSTRVVWLSGGILVLLLVASLGIVAWLATAWESDSPSADTLPAIGPAGMNELYEQANQREIREAQQARRRELLENYGWVDRQARLARIPLDRAMELMAGREGFDFPAVPEGPGEPDAKAPMGRRQSEEDSAHE